MNQLRFNTVNPALLDLARQEQTQLSKTSFVPTSAMDPAMAGGGGGGDPAAMMQDPAMMGMGGGQDMSQQQAPQAPAGMDPDTSAKLDQILQALQSGGAAGGAGGSGAALKPKIDVNVEIMQMKMLLAKICDALGIPVAAQDMVATPEKLQQMAQGQQPPTTPVQQQGGIQPIQPIQGMGQQKQSREVGVAGGQSVNFAGNRDKADAVRRVIAARAGHSTV